MLKTEQLVAVVTEAVLKKFLSIPVGVSNRHVHLSQADLVRLYGADAQLKKTKNLSQPGQFACEQTVTLVGPKGVIENVRVLGPLRTQTQVEISATDGFKLGVNPPVRDSGDLDGSAKLTLVGPEGSITLPQGVIIAARHIHMHENDALRFGVKEKDRVCIRVDGPRGVIFEEVLVRVSSAFQLEFHVDQDEANATGLHNQDRVTVLKIF
jgi:putative phosphotransacetylase